MNINNINSSPVSALETENNWGSGYRGGFFDTFQTRRGDLPCGKAFIVAVAIRRAVGTLGVGR